RSLWDEALHGEKGREPTEGFFRRHFAWQNWLGQFVPPTLAIVLGRSWFSRHQAGIGWRGGAGSGVYDQGMEFILLAGLLPASWLALEHSASRLVITLAALTGLLGAGGTIFLGRKYLPRLNPSFLLPLLLWSALRVVLTVARLATGVLALGLSLNLINGMAASPVVTLLALLPLTPGNLGLAEWGWVGVLKFAGEDATAAALYALGFRLLMLAAQSLLLAAQEGLFFILKKRKIQAA
ncbi:MAG: hypothetical protein HGA90_06615, partial [Alphaproteobacteria bacterium]|nr:hypothetical protein [Alphaproteobacteria bacterium]